MMRSDPTTTNANKVYCGFGCSLDQSKLADFTVLCNQPKLNDDDSAKRLLRRKTVRGIRVPYCLETEICSRLQPLRNSGIEDQGRKYAEVPQDLHVFY